MVTTIDTIKEHAGPRPDLVESGLVELVRAFFHEDQTSRVRDPLLKDLTWTSSEEGTDLWISTVDYFNERNPSTRPAINVRVGNTKFAGIMLNNGKVVKRSSMDKDYYSHIIKMPFVIVARDTASKMAWKVATAVGVRLQEAAYGVQRQLMLSDFEVKTITSPKKEKTDDYQSSVQGEITAELTFTSSST